MASWRYILFLLSFMGLFATFAIIAMLYWMAARIDQIDSAKSLALIELKVDESMNSLRLGVEDYSYWTLAYEMVLENNPEDLLENIGSGATDSNLFDQIFLLDENGALLQAYDESAGAEAHSLYNDEFFQPVLNALRQTKPADVTSATSILGTDGAASFVAAAWIIPEYVSDLPDKPHPIMIGVIHLDADKLAVVSQNAQLRSLALYPHMTASDANIFNLLLSDLNGDPVAALHWTKSSAGTQIRNELLPGVIIMGLGILGICGAAARYFRVQTTALEQANRVATTDQLTGLLNRAGLVEKQSQKDIDRSLKKGHLAAIYLDLNKFKALNDTYGHMAGDLALRVTAERLQSAVRRTDLVARLGGDEFVCIIVDPSPESAAVAVAERIIELTNAPIFFEGHDQVISASVGLAVSTPGTQWETLISQSDAAMYWSKQKRSPRPIVFCKSMDAGLEAA